ncbi:extracellular solute-binding protein [Kribbella turkmenica]|uniref:Extracellular solute-binding protein n=1 Tax=Kribbella turkmenica TaxID=2530375 RepID=A0A4R4X1C8_9ACTN|nr:extracellular solute-binding protein [Kribbella turkmenica]TDD23980.1 extracellular solute-binding protein [Kribbella turkmenica]
MLPTHQRPPNTPSTHPPRTLTRRSILALGAGSAAALAGCSSPFDDTTRGGGRVLEFTTFYTGPDGALMQTIVDRYNSSQDDVVVRFTAPAYGGDYLTKILTASLAGAPPAILALHSYEIPPLRRFLHTIDFNDLGFSQDDFVDGTWQLATIDGRQYGVTMSTGPAALGYNRALFEKAGLDPDRPPTTGAEFVAAAQALKKSGPWGFIRETGTFNPWLTLNWQAGGDLIDAGSRALFAEPPGIQAGQFERDLVHRYHVEPAQLAGPQLGALFRNQKVGMVFTFPWVLSQLLKTNAQQGTQLDVAPLPQFFGGPRSVVATSHIYCIPKQRKNDAWIQAEAQKFIAWLVREGSVDWAGAQAPASRAAAAAIARSNDPVVRKMALFIDEAKHARFAPYAYRWNQAFQYLNDALDDVVYQGADVAAELRRAAARATESMREPK